MDRRFGKHNIVGSEVHLPRPMAYMRSGFAPRRTGPRPAAVLMLCAAALLAALLAAWILA